MAMRASWLVAWLALMAGTATLAMQPLDAPSEHPVLGRYSVISEAGGAVWAFQSSGSLVVSGPGDLVATGTWSSVGLADRAFDALVEVGVTGQELSIVGEVSPDHAAVAMHVDASVPTAPDLAVPWPPESRLVGERLAMSTQPTPSSSPDIDCRRPSWNQDGSIDWDPCDALAAPVGASAPPSLDLSPSVDSP